MDTELKFEQIPYYDLLTKVVTTHEETTETTLPDYCATASRILETAGQLLVREKQAAEGILRGEVRVMVLYLSEETEGLQSVTVMVPFTCELSDPKLRACQMLQVHSRLLLCEAKPITGRKLYLRVIPELTVLGFGEKQLRFCCGAAGKGLQLRRESRQLRMLTAAEERSCGVTQEFDCGQMQVEEILMSQMAPQVTSCQQIGSKLVVKGEIRLGAMLRLADRKLYDLLQTLPFSQILDGFTPDAESAFHAEAQPAEWDLRLVRSDGGCRMGLTARLTLQVFACRTRQLSNITDLYSTCLPLQAELETVGFTQRCSPVCAAEWAEETLESGGGALFAYVTALDGGAVMARYENGRTELSTTVRIQILYQDESGTPVTAERSREIHASVDGSLDAVWVRCGVPELRGSAGTCQVRVPVYFCGITGEKAELQTVTAVQEKPTEEDTVRPSLVLRRAGCGECLWDIAKQHGSSEEAIRRYNAMEDDTLPDGMLLIPVLRT